jgi:hypothetical protein
MSRKGTGKSNIRIGIFSDKSAKYNLAILETLLPREATSWQIAEVLQKRLNPVEDKEVRFYRTQKVYSVIQRKKGRLDDLKNKGYIKVKDGKWSLTKKGLVALSVEKPELVAKELQAEEHKSLEQFEKAVSSLPNDTIREPLGIQINFAKTKRALLTLDPTRLLMILLEEAKALLSEGIELDRINEESLVDLAMFRAASSREIWKNK